MKKIRCCLALMLFACILCTLLLPALAKTGTAQKNTGVRDTVCTALSAQAQAYYTGANSYEALATLPGVYTPEDSYAATQSNALYTALYTLMDTTHTDRSTVYAGYSARALATHWLKTDAEAGSNSYLYFYTDVLASDSSVSGVTMNREHVWPKSRASFYQLNGGADLHHLRPSIAEVNASKSNHAFGELDNGTANACEVNGSAVIWTDGAADLLEVRDNVKGDVARILLYIYVRWQQPNLYTNVAASKLPAMDSDDTQSNGVKVIESLDTLLNWCRLDPVDDWEMERNDQVECIQGNRNVFIDYPELAWLMFGCKVPQMQSPSGGTAQSYTVSWSVDGKTTQEQVPVGEMPYFKGTTEKADDAENFYQFVGWTPALAPVSKDTTYTAQYRSTPLPEKCFDDVKSNDWFYPAIRYTTANGTMSGSGDGHFAPTVEMTRAMLVSVLYRMEGSEPLRYAPTFSDVPEGKWYTPAVLWAAKEDIVSGTGGGCFDPEGRITREQIAVILFRYAAYLKRETAARASLTAFPDGGSVSSWATEATSWAVGCKLLQGQLTGGKAFLNPQHNAMRAEVAVILQRFDAK